ncbi:MAG: outer membrane beta-barrel family protein [Bacteroidales bacterium]|nr:outer membrane beta-barrel family protein [Bacteroidales bacterium]
MINRYAFLLVVATLLISFSSFAQQRGFIMKADITLSVRDSLTNAPLELVTAVLTRIDRNNNKEIFTYAISDSAGIIKFNRVPASDYEISLQYMGYYMKLVPNIKIDARDLVQGNTLKALGVVKLRENVAELKAAKISEHVVPIKYLGDTIQYNAAAFKLTDSDVLEDFFKKLPGWSVDRDGKITANGKVIDQITVNGRIFFLDDPVFVSKNLPAKLLKNIKLFEKESDKSKFTGIDDGSRKNTVDVAVKEEMLNGWLANIKAGGGTEKRYKTNNFVSNFNKYNQIAIIGNASNLNETISIPGISSPAMGLSSDYNLGGNINLTEKKNKFVADISYKLNGKNSLNENEMHRVNYIKDSSFVYDKSTKNENTNNSHTFNGVLTRNGKKSMIVIKPTARFSYGNYSDSTKYTTIGGESGVILNEGESVNSGKRNSESISTDFLIITRANKKFRTFSINGSLGYDRTANEGRNRILNKTDQKYFIDNKSLGFSAQFSYTEPITKKILFGTNYRLSSSFSSKSKETYNPGNNGNFTSLDTLLSDKSDNTEFRQNIELFLQKPKGKDEISYYMIGVSIMPSYLKRSAENRNIDKWFVNFSPKAELRISTKKLSQFFLTYKGNVRTPDLSMMVPVPDNTNPLFFRIGNTGLKSEYEHNASLILRKITNVGSGQATGIFLNANASYFTSRILNKSWFDENGIQYSMPFNDSGDYSINARLAYDQPFFKGALYIGNSFNAGYYNNISYVNGERNITKRKVIGESARVSFKSGDFGINASASFNYELSENSIFPDKKTKTWRNNIEGSIRYLLPLGIDLRTDLSYQYFTGYSNQYDKPYLLWNAEVSKPLVRNKLTLTISARDILNQNKNIQREITDFYVQETRYNVVRQYFLFTLTYKFLTGGKTGAFKERANSIQRSQESLIFEIGNIR